MSPKPQPSKRTAPENRKNTPAVVDPIWLIKALGFNLLAAVLCGYATICLLYYQGAWQLLLHPGRTISDTPASVNLNFTDIRFDSSETGQPRLTAWWIPAESLNGLEARYSTITILYLHDGSGSLSATLPMLTQLHLVGINVFAIDYRGFGDSDASVHPSEHGMDEDAESALIYLTATRHIPIEQIIPYGAGLGGSLAAHLARKHPSLPAIVLDNPDPDPEATAAAQSSPLLPRRLLLGNPFDIANPISAVTVPKLLIAGGPNAKGGSPDIGPLQMLFKRAASPSFTLTLPPGNDEGYRKSLQRFLDQYTAPRRP